MSELKKRSKSATNIGYAKKSRAEDGADMEVGADKGGRSEGTLDDIIDSFNQATFEWPEVRGGLPWNCLCSSSCDSCFSQSHSQFVFRSRRL
jgi:hypothetical protein